MITVKDAFKLCNVKKLALEYEKTLPSDFDMENEKAAMILWYDEILKIEPLHTDDNFVIMAYMSKDTFDDEVESYLDVSVVKQDEITDFVSIEEINVETKTNDELYAISRKLRNVESYAFEFSPWNEILAYFVPNALIEQYGLETLMASIVHEMTFFGYEENTKEEEKEELIRRADECEEMLKKPKEEQEKYFIPAEKVFEELGYKDERTEEEKQRDSRNSCLDNYFSQKSFATSINLILEEIKRGVDVND